MAYKHISFLTSQGGHLIAGTNSGDTAGATNYVEKLNFRRESDGEVRREGWEKLNVDGSVISQLNSENYPVRMVNQFASEETHVLVASAGDKIFRYKEDTNSWVVIASGLQSMDIDPTGSIPPAIRMEVVAIDGYCIFNNGVDVPLFYREDWPCAFPMYSLRERGIIRCGTIAEYDGRLWIADVQYVEDKYFDDLMKSTSPYGVPEADTSLSFIPSGIYRVPHAIEYSAWRISDAGEETRAAPHLFGQVYGQDDGKMYSTGGIKSIAVVEEGYYDNHPTITITDSKAGEHPDFPGGSGAVVVANMVEEPVNSGWWKLGSVTVTNPGSGYRAPVVSVTAAATNETQATATATVDMQLKGLELPHPISIDGNLNPYFSNPTWSDAGKKSEPNALRIGDEVRVVDEGTTDAKITGIAVHSGKTMISLAVSSSTTPNTDGETAYLIPLKEPDVGAVDSSIAREASDSLVFPEDGSRILKMAKLSDKLLVYRQTGYIAISRGNAQSPFFYEERYRGERVADFRNSIISLNEQRQMFVGYNGAYFITPSSVEPEPMPTFMNGPEFWRHVTDKESEHVFAVENGLTQEVMVVAPVGLQERAGNQVLDWGVVAFDLIYGTLSLIDSAFTAATTIFPMGKITSRWFLLATHKVADLDASSGVFIDSEETGEGATSGAHLMRYGYGPAEEGKGPYREFARDGADYVSRLRFGKTDFGNRFSEKNLRSYLIHLSDAFPKEGYSSYMGQDYVGAADGETDPYLLGSAAKVTIATYAAAPTTKVDEVVEVMDNMGSQNMIPLHARGNYYQDSVEITGREIGFKFIGRTFEVSGVQTRHVSEAVQVVEVVDA